MSGAVAQRGRSPAPLQHQVLSDTVGGVHLDLHPLQQAQAVRAGDFKVGNKIFNNTFGYRCQTRNSCFENVAPLEADPVKVAVAQSNRLYWNSYLLNGSFAKLREVALSYTLPDRWARHIGATGARITLTGRNLHTWTSYEGVDPGCRSFRTSSPGPNRPIPHRWRRQALPPR